MGREADLYESEFVPNIARALSLVPDHMRVLQHESSTHYVAMAAIQDPTVRRDLDRSQMELVAARIADSTGIPLDGPMVAITADLRGELELSRFRSAANTAGV